MTVKMAAESNVTAPAAHPHLAQFYEDFRLPSGVLSLVIATIGVVFNVMNITILVHAKMRNPVNLLLTMSAVSQLCLLVIYIPYLFMFNLAFPASHPRHHTGSPGQVHYFLFFADASVFFQMVSSWLIITTAFFRFIYVQFPLKSATFCNYRMAVVAGVSTAFACLLVQIPNMMLNGIVEKECNDSEHSSNEICEDRAVIYTIDGDDKENQKLVRLNLGLLAVVGRFIPAVLLSIFTMFLIKVLRDAHSRKKRLNSDAGARGADSQKNEHAQTTKMLTAVVVMYCCVELPHGVLLGYVMVTGDWLLYQYVGEVIELVTILTFSLNLVLYSTMSRQYRTLFKDIFVKPLNDKLRNAKSSLRRGKYSATASYTEHRGGKMAAGAESCAVSVTLDTHIHHSTILPDEEKHEEEVGLVSHKGDNYNSSRS